MFKNMKIKTKLIASFVIVAIIASISGIIGSYLYNKSDADYSFALENYGFSQGKIGRLGMEVNANMAYTRDAVYMADPVQREAAFAKVDAGIIAINNLMEEVRPTNTSDAAKALFATIEQQVVDYRTPRDRVIQLAKANDLLGAQALWESDASPKVTKIAESITALMKMNFDVGTEVSNDLTAMGKTMSIVLLGIIALGFIVSLLFAVFIARSISKPIIEIEVAAVKIAKGEYDAVLTYHSNDEVGSLAGSMRQMITSTEAILTDTANGLEEIAKGNFDVSPAVEYVGIFKKLEDSIVGIIGSLSKTMSEITQASEQVASGSDQVSSAAQSLAQGATEQASAIEELSASISEISDQIKQSADNADSVQKVASTVSTNIDASNQQMTQMMVAMDDISTSSAEISKIIKAIEDIAFQTNILALNAAVEAARAGNAGKGFAVVADEVRNLASKSAEAAKQTNDLIESSVDNVAKGSKIAQETAKSLIEVVGGARDINSLISKIAQASTEQAVSISQINLGIDQISSVVQTNSATSEESAAASEELFSQANLMNELISRFNLKKGAF